MLVVGIVAIAHGRKLPTDAALGALDSAVAAIGERLDATHRAAFVTFVSATTAVAFVVLGAACDGAVSVHDQRAGTHHGIDGSE